MANKKSAEKRNRQNIKTRARNARARAACRTAVKATKKAIEEGQLDQAKELFLKAERVLSSAATKGLYHQKNVSRKISRLSEAVSKAAK